MGKQILLNWTRLLLLVMTIGLSGMISQESWGQATVMTDKSDYQPGDTVLITGSGWLPGEVVELSIREIPTHNPNIIISTIADAEGNIFTKDFVTQQHHLGKSLFVMANGNQGSFAQTHFTDASYTSKTSGNWNDSNTWDCTGPGCGSFPGINDDVVINNRYTVTLTANAAAKTLQVSGANSNQGNTILNVGTFSLNVTDHLNLISSNNNRQAIVNVNGGTVEVNTINLTTGSTGNPGNVNLNLSGNSFLNVSGGINLSGISSNINPSETSTVNYNGTSNQTIVPLDYGNLILSGSGTKSFSSGISINGNLSVAAGVIANLGTFNSSSGSLTLGGLGTDNGSWGSTSSTATFKNNTFFTANTGIITVNTDTRATPTVTLTIGTYVFNGNQNGPTAATNTGTGTSYTFSYAGVSPTTYGPSPTRPINAGTYTVTATVAASTDGFYKEASSIATLFSIAKAASTISVDAAGPFTYNATPQGPDQVTKSGSTGAVTFSYVGVSGTSYAASSVKPTNAGSYEVTATLAGDDNYNGAVSDALAFSIAKAASTISVDAAGPFTYNATPQGPDQVTKTGSTGAVTFTYVGVSGTSYAASSTKPTNAGSYEVTAILAGDDNYNGAVSDALAFSIAKATITVSNTDRSKVYGQTLTNADYAGSISGVVAGDNITVTRASAGDAADATVAGSPYSIVGTLVDPDGRLANYEVINPNGVLTVTKAPTTITLANSLANCNGDQVTLIATVNTINASIQSDIDGLGGTVTFKNGSNVLGTVNVASVSGGIFSGTFSIGSLAPGATYNISAEFVPNSGNLTGSQTTSLAQLTVLQAFINSSVAKNTNGNVVIFDGAASSLGLPSSTILTATYQPSTYPGVTYKWYQRNVGGSFSIISGATGSTYQVLANGDFVREYMVELIVNGICVGNAIFSQVISVEASCGKEGQNKVQVCHVTPNGKRNTICVSANAVEALLKGSPGSYVGNCNISYRAEQEPELITVPWNTPVELIKIEILKQSEKWFNRKKVNMNVSTEAYDALQPGLYTLTAQVEANDFYQIDEPIAINVLVLDKPKALDILVENSKLTKDLRAGDVLGTLTTIDPVDDIHTYSLFGNDQVELMGNQLIWRGDAIPAQLTFTVLSSDRAGQTISREITLSRELKAGEFFLYPNPAQRETNVMVDLDREATVAIRIYDAVGRLVVENEAFREGSFTQTFNLDGLAAGFYTVQVKVGDMVMTKRLIKK